MKIAAPIETRIFRGFGELDAKQWDRLPLDGFYASSPWLESVEGALSPHSGFVVAEAADGRAVGGLVAYPVATGAFVYLDALGLMLGESGIAILEPYFSAEQLRRVAKLVAALAPLVAGARPTATAVIPFGYSSAWAHGGSSQVARRLLDGFHELHREWGARSSAFLYVDESDAVTRGCLEERGYVSTVIEARALLPVRFGDFGGYLASLGSNRRHQIRKELRAIEGLELETTLVDGSELHEWMDELAPLAADLMAKHGNPRDVERERDSFRRIQRSLARFARVAVVRRQGRAVCFALFYEADGALHVSFSGNDYSTPRAHFLAAYYAPLEHALRRGAVLLDYGMGAHETKVNRGCQLSLQRGFLDLGGEGASEVKELMQLVEAAQRRRFARSVGP